jgi:hypothetical protein
MGLGLILFSLLFVIGETAYFGFNMKPINNDEFYCYLFSLITFYVGYILWKIGKERD